MTLDVEESQYQLDQGATHRLLWMAHFFSLIGLLCVHGKSVGGIALSKLNSPLHPPSTSMWEEGVGGEEEKNEKREEKKREKKEQKEDVEDKEEKEEA